MNEPSDTDREWYLVYSEEEIGSLPYEVEYRIGPSDKGSEWHIFKHVYSLGEGDYEPEQNSELVATVAGAEIRRHLREEIGVELPDSRWREMGLSEELLAFNEEELDEQEREEKLIDEAVTAVERGEPSGVSSKAIGVIMNRLGLSPGATHRNFDDRVAILAWPESWKLEWDPGYSFHYLPESVASDKRKEELENGAEPTPEEKTEWQPGALRSWSHTRNAWVADILRFEARTGKVVFLVEEWTGVPSTFLHQRKITGLFRTEEEARSKVLDEHPEAVEIPDWPRPSLKS